MGVGRKRLPDAVHQRRGTLRRDRHGDPDQKIQLEAYTGEPPETLDDEGKREWFRVVGAMKDTGIVTRVDRTVLAMYCGLWSDYNTALRTRESWPATNYAQLRNLCSELGFTPASRAKIVVPKQDKPTGFADL